MNLHAVPFHKTSAQFLDLRAVAESVDDDIGALAGECRGDPQANAARRARDKGRPTLKLACSFLGHGFLLSRSVQILAGRSASRPISASKN